MNAQSNLHKGLIRQAPSLDILQNNRHSNCQSLDKFGARSVYSWHIEVMSAGKAFTNACMTSRQCTRCRRYECGNSNDTQTGSPQGQVNLIRLNHILASPSLPRNHSILVDYLPKSGSMIFRNLFFAATNLSIDVR